MRALKQAKTPSNMDTQEPNVVQITAEQFKKGREIYDLMSTRRMWLPVLVLFRDRKIDCYHAKRFLTSILWVRKGRVLTLENFSKDGAPGIIEVSRYLKIDGIIYINPDENANPKAEIPTG